MGKIDKKDIQNSVADFYKGVANDEIKVKVDSKDLSESIGYSKEELKDIPEEANLGLGCGNPLIDGKPMPGETVLDLGCGKGMDVFNTAKKVGKEGFVIGVDMTPEMIKTARRIEKGRKFTNTHFRLGEIEYLPVADNSIDLVISNCVINLSTDKEQVYREILRVLKPGGRISIADIVHIKDLPESVLSDPRMYGTCVAGGGTAKYRKELLEKLGYRNIEIKLTPVSKEYVKKWGIDEIPLEEYIASSITVAYK